MTENRKYKLSHRGPPGPILTWGNIVSRSLSVLSLSFEISRPSTRIEPDEASMNRKKERARAVYTFKVSKLGIVIRLLIRLTRFSATGSVTEKILDESKRYERNRKYSPAYNANPLSSFDTKGDPFQDRSQFWRIRTCKVVDIDTRVSGGPVRRRLNRAR